MQELDGDNEQLLNEVQALRDRLAALEGEHAECARGLDELRDSERKWRQLAQSAPDIIISVDRDGTILQLNRPAPGSQRVEDLIGTNCYTYIPPEQHDKFRQSVEYVFQTGQSTSYEISAYGLDGDLRWWSTHFGPAIVDGRITASTAVATEITVRKRAEVELKLLSAELARSNGELEQFAYIASHDLQEPLRKVQAFGDMLVAKCHEGLTDEGRDYLQRMQSAAKRMQTLINDLLTYSRVTTQAKPFAELDLGQITLEVLSDLEPRIRQTEGVVEIGELPRLEADPTQMRQLLQNLIVNALKYHPEGEPPRVSVAGRILAGDDGVAATTDRVPWCEIAVRDNGIGFDEKYLDRIFVPFQRLHGRGEYDGSGMGLAVCQRIVTRHGGEITARSRPGHGSTFLVTLPQRQGGVAPRSE